MPQIEAKSASLRTVTKTQDTRSKKEEIKGLEDTKAVK
jgi:hypothetical protein